MRVLYIGHYMPGCTTRMRGEYLQELLQPEEFFVINTDIPIYNTNKLFRSIGWRYYKGPLIKNVNSYIKKQLEQKKDFDIVWIDKGVFIDPLVLSGLKKNKTRLIHFTPDTAFTNNRSNLFDSALPLYDYCITTKSFELDHYKKTGAKKVLYCTQGFDPKLHKNYYNFSQKNGVAFIGLKEPSREEAIAKLIEKKIPVKLAGAKWNNFISKYKSYSNLQYLGEGLFQEAYAKTISGSLISLGLLSKKFPELHTTRTFEIPACGTALATEDNTELRQFYSDDEVLFFSDYNEMTEKIDYYLQHPQLLEVLIAKGQAKATNGKFDYKGILKNLLDEMGVPI